MAHIVVQAQQARRSWTGDIWTAGHLPDDVVRSASHRLSSLAFLVGTLVLVAIGFAFVDGLAQSLERAHLVALVFMFVASGIIAVLANRVVLDAQQVYLVGLTYLSLLAFVAGINRFAWDWGANAPGWDATSVIAMLFPVLLPCAPGRAAVAALTIGLSGLLGHGAVLLITEVVPPIGPLLRSYFGEIAAVPIAAFVAFVVYGLGRDLEQARRVGAYVLEERLGQGGMGEVWRARHELLARPAAIKLMRLDTLARYHGEARQSLYDRFEREARATAMLQSPHTIEVYDFGAADDGAFYYVMELLRGIDLHDAVARYGPMPAERVVFILLQACRSLAEAHRHGLIHRDIKPSNLMLCRYADEVDYLKVLDFGLVTPDFGHRDVRLTTTGQITGTPAFMSPEQAEGVLDIDGRSDLYSLGCVAYWMLTGWMVFEGATAVDMVTAHRTEPPRAPSARVELSIPPMLEEIVMMCLEKDPAQRPADAIALASMLRRVHLPREWDAERASLWWRNHLGDGSSGPGHEMPATVSLPEEAG